MSSGSNVNNDAVNDSSANVEETLNRLFEESKVVADGGSEAWQQAASAAWEPTWYNLSDQAVNVVLKLHDVSGLDYGLSIIGVTIMLRLSLFPLMVKSQRASSRMAHLQPELNQMKARYEAIGAPSRQDQLQFGNQMKALFAKYDVKPIQAFAAPLVQLPLFMGMFFGLRKMPS